MGARRRSLVQSRRNRETGTTITVWDLDAPGAPLDRTPTRAGIHGDPRWLTMCETHDGENVGHYTLADALAHAAMPSGWCGVCQKIPKCSTCFGRCTWVDDAWVCDRCGDEWPPDGSDYAIPAEDDA
jgi:hypothetical protein